MNEDPIDILCIGSIVYDITMLVERHPTADDKLDAYGCVQCGGGPAANAALQASKLGMQTALSGYLGRDVFGDLHIEELERDGVDTSLISRGDSATRLSVVMVKPNGERALANYRDARSYLPADAIDFSTLSTRCLLVDGHELDATLVALEWAGAHGIPSILDAGSYDEPRNAISPLVDYIVASESYALSASGASNARDAVSMLAVEEGQTLVVTVGGNGVLWREGSEVREMPAFEVDVVDTTGAGDSFHGAFAAAVVRGYSLQEAIRFSSAAAALSCTTAGSRTGLPTNEDVEQFLRASQE